MPQAISGSTESFIANPISTPSAAKVTTDIGNFQATVLGAFSTRPAAPRATAPISAHSHGRAGSSRSARLPSSSKNAMNPMPAPARPANSAHRG